MKKIITILGLALSAIVLSNTAFANNLIVDTVSVPQCHIKAYNTTDTLTTKTIWYFIFDLDNQTATLTYPRTDFNNIDEPFSTGYNFGFVGLEGIWNQNMYNCWSNVIKDLSPGSEYLFYTALRIREKVERGNVEYTVTGIGDNAFNGSNINYIDVPKTVERIGKLAFANSEIIGQCEASPYQVIPNSVKELGDSIFLNCRNLKRIDIDATVTSIPKGTFDGCFYTTENSKDATFEIRFGEQIKTLDCAIKIPENLPTNAPTPYIRVAFSANTVNRPVNKFDVDEIWYPENNSSYLDTFPDYDLHPYSITPEKSEYEVEYSKLPLKLNFTQKSYFKNPNSVYNYIYYYPAGGGINFSVNALTGRGANKVRFRMLFDGLDHVWQANKVYQIIRQDTATSYAYLDFNATDTVYEVTVRSLDFTRAEAKVKINVKGLIPVQRVVLTPDTNVIVNKDTVLINAGDSARIISRVVDRKNIIAYNQDVKWSSSNESIASVDEHGIVTGIAPGLAYIYATSIAPDVTNVYGAYKVLVSEPEQDSPSTPQATGMAIENNISISTSGRELTIRSNAPLGKVDIYSFDGRLVKSLNSSMAVETVNLSSSGIYIVKTTAQTIKIKI
ncbi:MAG: leucine-rich repeat protein [Paramuribaculum sp.]|nr:leucine-rich repeat protein [Paramuribaculum sp.]